MVVQYLEIQKNYLELYFSSPLLPTMGFLLIVKLKGWTGENCEPLGIPYRRRSVTTLGNAQLDPDKEA